MYQFYLGAPDSKAAKKLLARTYDQTCHMATGLDGPAADANATPSLSKPIFIDMN